MSADLKISQLASASALTGAELVPLVQGGANVRATVSTLVSTPVTQTPTGGFAENNTAFPPRVHRISDRMYVGYKSDTFIGDWPSATGLDPVPQYLHNWAPREATVWVDAPNGGLAVVGHAQRSRKTDAGIVDYTSVQGAGIGVSGFAINDFVGGGGAWGGYFEAVRFPSTGFTVGMEVTVANLGNYVDMNPYNFAIYGGTGAVSQAGACIRVGAGAGLSAIAYDDRYGVNNDIAAGLVLVGAPPGEGPQMGKGIIVANNALRDISLGSNVYSALEMPPSHQISWTRLNGTTVEGSAFIWERDTTLGQDALGIKFGSDGITLRSGATPIARFAPVANGVNNIVFVSAAAAGNVGALAEGTDTDVNFLLRPKGAGALKLQGADGTDKIRISTTGVGFFGTNPVAKPTGVAVSTAGIHAALVTLGLIAA